MTSRQIFKGRGKAESEAEGLLQTILLAELVSPSEVIWLISPWVTDVSILDNRAGAYAGVEPTWGRRAISLVEVLAALLRKGVNVVIATRPDAHNTRFVQRLESAARSNGCSERLIVHQDEREGLHEKGLLGDDYYVSGSMNFTESGIRLNDEAVKLELNPQAVAQARVHFRQNYGTP
jgi:phosphatidylserine/phosphatidylglycerophosphate/cardiolipin synthase-like enzyme